MSVGRHAHHSSEDQAGALLADCGTYRESLHPRPLIARSTDDVSEDPRPHGIGPRIVCGPNASQDDPLRATCPSTLAMGRSRRFTQPGRKRPSPTGPNRPRKPSMWPWPSPEALPCGPPESSSSTTSGRTSLKPAQGRRTKTSEPRGVGPFEPLRRESEPRESRGEPVVDSSQRRVAPRACLHCLLHGGDERGIDPCPSTFLNHLSPPWPHRSRQREPHNIGGIDRLGEL